MNITIVEVVEYKYPGQIQKNNVRFRQSLQDEIVISWWNIANEAQPTEQELIAFGIANARAIEIKLTVINALQHLQLVIDSTARSKGYGGGVSCASYSTSTNAQWQAEANAFIAWRDTVFNYAINIQNQVQSNTIPLPTLEEFMNGIPEIIWPT